MDNKWLDKEMFDKEKEIHFALEAPPDRGLIFGSVANRHKGHSTKEGSNPKAIAKRRKRNKNKKTHRL